MSVAGTRPTVPLDELARCSRAARHFAALRSTTQAALVPDRHPGHPPRPEPGRLNTRTHELARTGSTAAPVAHVRSLRVTSAAEPPVLEVVGGLLAQPVAPGVPVTPAAVARALHGPHGRFAGAGSAHRDPPTAPPSRDEGDLFHGALAPALVRGAIGPARRKADAGQESLPRQLQRRGMNSHERLPRNWSRGGPAGEPGACVERWQQVRAARRDGSCEPLSCATKRD
jgi:hypothetical protein